MSTESATPAAPAAVTPAGPAVAAPAPAAVPAAAPAPAEAPGTVAAPLMAAAQAPGEQGAPAPGEAPLMAAGNQEDKAKSGEEAAAEVDYGKLKLPEGFEANATMAKAHELFKEAKLPMDQAQKLLDLYFGEMSESAKAAEKRNVEAVTAWRKEITERPEFKTELPLVQLAIEDMAKTAPEIRELYNDPVFGNMPQLWKIALAFGQRFHTEGAMLSGGRDGAPATASLPEMLYPSMKKQ